MNTSLMSPRDRMVPAFRDRPFALKEVSQCHHFRCLSNAIILFDVVQTAEMITCSFSVRRASRGLMNTSSHPCLTDSPSGKPVKIGVRRLEERALRPQPTSSKTVWNCSFVLLAKESHVDASLDKFERFFGPLFNLGLFFKTNAQ